MYDWYFADHDIPQLPSNQSASVSDNNFVYISWKQPKYSPDYYNVSYFCQQILTTQCTFEGSINVTATNHTFSNSSLPSGSSCDISVVAVYDGIGMSNTVSSTVNTTIQGNKSVL